MLGPHQRGRCGLWAPPTVSGRQTHLFWVCHRLHSGECPLRYYQPLSLSTKVVTEDNLVVWFTQVPRRLLNTLYRWLDWPILRLHMLVRLSYDLITQTMQPLINHPLIIWQDNGCAIHGTNMANSRSSSGTGEKSRLPMNMPPQLAKQPPSYTVTTIFS